MAENWHIKGCTLKITHNMPVYMSRTILLHFDGSTGALSGETISGHVIRPKLVTSK
jgi:hypothetical protein